MIHRKQQKEDRLREIDIEMHWKKEKGVLKEERKYIKK